MSLLLVDGSWAVCSLWWAQPGETPARFAATVERVAESVGATGTPTIAWDAPGGSWRSEILPSYKGHRKAKPEALVLDLLRCRKLPGMRHVEVAGFEADDILATLAEAQNVQVYILTADKDLTQLVGPGISLVNARGELTGPAEVEAKFGVPPSRMRHYLSWAGDSSDGLPGVKGIGEKRAIPHALNGEMGDALTWELVGLATVPGL